MVTIDAIGTRREVARLLEEREARYIQVLKDNQPKLAEDVGWLLENQLHPSPAELGELDFHQTHDKAHGREEIRRCWVSDQIDFLQPHRWPGLQAVALVESERTLMGTTTTTLDRRLFLLNHTPKAHHLLNDVRNHWGIENRLHWVLDVVFNEDDHPLSKGHAPQNFNILRQLALELAPQPHQTRPLQRFY